MITDSILMAGFNHRAPCAVKRVGIAGGIGLDRYNPVIRNDSSDGHRRPNSSASETRLTPRLSLRGRTS